MPAIFVDPGHGGKDPGAIGIGSVQEKDLNLKVALYLRDILLGHGFNVKMSRETDVFVEINDSAAAANAWGADAVVSVHHNAGKGDGAEVISSIYKAGGDILANAILDQFIALGQNKHGSGIVHKLNSTNTADYYGMIRLTKAPAVITEYCFVDTADLGAVDTDDKLYAEAAAITHGLCKYFNVDWDVSVAPVVPDVPQATELQTAVGVLVDKCIIVEPAYWLANAVPGGTIPGEYAAALIKKMAKLI